MSSEQKKIISYKKSFTPKNIIYHKEKKQYLNENENSTESTDQQYESKALLKVEKIIGNYTLTNQINKTSYTKIFLAKHILTGEDVCIRIINKQLFKNDLLSLTRFNKELQIIKKVKHPNIVKLLEIIETNLKIYLIFEYYPHNLLNYIESEKKFSENKARFYFQQLISALNYLHLMNISHRNIKPENILLDEKYTKIKITGFEVSTFYNPGSLLYSPVGNLIYAPPEMILSQKYKGELNDIWDAGIVLYAMVCGNLPFSQDSQDININHIIEGFYDIPKDISSNCVEVIKSCLECNPEKRITFNKLKTLKWIKYNNFNYIKGINIHEEKIVVDDKILQECKKYISANNQDILNKIKKSVIENKFDEFSSLYYLVLQKEIKNGYKNILNLDKNNKNKYIIKYINLTNSSDDNNSDKEKDDLSNYSSHTHTNSFSSLALKRNKIDYFDNSNIKNINLVKKYLYSKTIRNEKKRRNHNINISSTNCKIKNYLFSPKNKKPIDNKHNILKIKNLNTIKLSDLKNNDIMSPKIYTKKTSFISNPKYINVKSKNKIEKCNTNISLSSTDKIRIEDENNYNNTSNISNNIRNKNINDDDSQPLNTLFVNRVKNNNNNYYMHKKKNQSSEGFYHSSKNKNNNQNTRTNLISINKKNLSININNKEKNKDKNDNIDKILMDDKPIANFSMNFNNTLLNNNHNKKILNELSQNELNANNINISESDYFIKQSVIKKPRKNAKSYKRLDHFFETPKKGNENINYLNYENKNNLKNNHYFKLSSSNKGNKSISESFNKYFPTKKIRKPGVLRNSLNEQYYNTTLYHEEKTLNKIRSFGGFRITKNKKEKKENNLPKIFSQNTFIVPDKYNNSKCYDNNNNKKTINKKENKNIDKNLYTFKFKESTNTRNNIGVLDLLSLKYCSYQNLIDKIYKILKKYKIKYYLINTYKIHCSSKNGLFFDIEIKDFKTKKSNINTNTNTNNKKLANNNINIYKNNNIGKNNNKISVQKLGYTYLNFKKNDNKNENKKNELYYITFLCKNNDFKKKNEKLIHEILG